jgi:hypothetical protein
MRTRLIAAIVIVVTASNALLGATLFFDDFQSYAPGSNLIGQNGWVGWTGVPSSGPATIIVQPGTGLPTQVMDGRADTGYAQEQLAERYVAHRSGLEDDLHLRRVRWDHLS